MRIQPVGPRRISPPVQAARIEQAKARTETLRRGDQVRAERTRESLEGETRAADSRRRTPSVDVLA